MTMESLLAMDDEKLKGLRTILSEESEIVDLTDTMEREETQEIDKQLAMLSTFELSEDTTTLRNAISEFNPIVKELRDNEWLPKDAKGLYEDAEETGVEGSNATEGH